MDYEFENTRRKADAMRAAINTLIGSYAPTQTREISAAQKLRESAWALGTNGLARLHDVVHAAPTVSAAIQLCSVCGPRVREAAGEDTRRPSSSNYPPATPGAGA